MDICSNAGVLYYCRIIESQYECIMKMRLEKFVGYEKFSIDV